MRTAAIVAVCVLALSACQDAAPRGEPVPQDEAASVLESTPWLDSAPRDERDVNHAYVFQDGEGLYFVGNSYKATFEMLRYWLDGGNLKLRFLDENKAYETTFKIEKYKGEIFDYKLTLKKDPRGPKVYYGFDNDHHDLPAVVTKLNELAGTR